MSSSTLITIQTQLNKYGYPIFMILGNIGNVFIIIIFSRQRPSACAIYLISSAVVNIIYLTFDGFFLIFLISYGDGIIHTITLCRIYIYTLNVIGQIAKTMIILACIDRFLITSTQTNFRAFSTPKRAKYIIFVSVIFWALFIIPFPIMRTIVNGQCITSAVFSIIYSIYAILFIGFIPTIVSGIFGYLTYRNMRRIHVRIQSVVHNRIEWNIFFRRQDRELLIIVIVEVVTYAVTTALFPFIRLEMIISEYAFPNKSFHYLQIEIFILNIAYFLLFINSAASFYTYFISSKSFRRDFKQLIIKIYWKLTRQTPIEIISRTDRTLIQQETHV